MILQLGEVRKACEKNEELILEDLINKNSYRSSYYILKHTNWEGQFSNVMRSKYILMSRRPPIPLLGTKLWLIDNRRGTITLEWELPFDIVNADICATDNIGSHALTSAQKWRPPLVHA